MCFHYSKAAELDSLLSVSWDKLSFSLECTRFWASLYRLVSATCMLAVLRCWAWNGTQIVRSSLSCRCSFLTSSSGHWRHQAKAGRACFAGTGGVVLILSCERLSVSGRRGSVSVWYVQTAVGICNSRMGCLNPLSEREGQKYLALKGCGPSSCPQVGLGLWVLHHKEMCGHLWAEVPRMVSRGLCKAKPKDRTVLDPLDLWGFTFRLVEESKKW